MSSSSVVGGTLLEIRLKDLAGKIKSNLELRVGFLEGVTYPDGETMVAMVAAIHEFGAPRAGVPARSFFRPLIAAKSSSWGEAFSRLLKMHDYDVEKVLNLLGIAIQAQLRQAIIDVNDPPLSKVTLMLRKMLSEDQSLVVTGKVVGEAAARVASGESVDGVSTKPLDYTGYMIKKVDFEVKAKTSV